MLLLYFIEGTVGTGRMHFYYVVSVRYLSTIFVMTNKKFTDEFFKFECRYADMQIEKKDIIMSSCC